MRRLAHTIYSGVKHKDQERFLSQRKSNDWCMVVPVSDIIAFFSLLLMSMYIK